MIELSDDIKKAIGPLRINHAKEHSKRSETFDAMKDVDDYIQQAQRARARPSKDKGKDKQPQSTGPSVIKLEGSKHPVGHEAFSVESEI